MAAASPLNHSILHPIPYDWSWLPSLRGALLALLLLAAIPAGVFAVAEAVEGLAAPPVVEESEVGPARVWPTRIVPVEWRWSPRGLDVDRMFPRRR